jgi:cytoskeleton protein RodZ
MSIGAQLRASREARGLSIDAVAHATRVQPRILAAIERDDVAAVPPRPFGRGFVRSYAQEIGLDPDKVARDYFAQFAPPPPSVDAPEEPTRDMSRGVTPLAIATFGIAAGLAIALFLGRSWAAKPASPAGQAIGTSGSTQATAPPTDTAVAPPAAAVAPPAPAAAPAPSAPLSVVLTATRKSWVTARADGRRALFQIILPGSPQTVSATREIELRVGDAGALQWVINGRSAGAMGRPGQVRDIRVTPATAATIQ